ncbi:uncharacterized protein [Centruroides vittatus]|uniref:uncharacterized protein isoform X1 n=1 Tax=Centruroides vittatus TaxID=120091 RepID=UPI00350EE7BC
MDIPGVEMEVPALEVDIPAMKMGIPAVEVDILAMEVNMPAVEVEVDMSKEEKNKILKQEITSRFIDFADFIDYIYEAKYSVVD